MPAGVGATPTLSTTYHRQEPKAQAGARNQKRKRGMKIKHHKKARYWGEDNGLFEVGKVYRGDFYEFAHGILFRYRTRVYQSGKANWEFEE